MKHGTEPAADTPDEAVLTSHHLSAVIRTSKDFVASSRDLVDLLSSSARAVGLTPVAHTEAAFDPAGASAVVLLAESHVAVHHWPECDRLTVDIHVCDYRRDNLARAWQLARLVEENSAQEGVDWCSFSVAE